MNKKNTVSLSASTSVKALTYAQALDYVLTNVDLPENVADKLDALYNKYSAKPTGERKLTKAQKETALLTEKVYECMEVNRLYSCKELADHWEVSVPKMSAMLKKLVDADRLTKAVEKGKSYFSKGE